MQAEIISNGDEIITGKILDTNSQWLSIELDNIGVEPVYHTAVGDDLAAMTGVLKTAMQRADIIIWTGGLGPTADDLTRQAIADAAGVPLVKDEQSLKYIQSIFQCRGYAMPEANNVQAFQPQSAAAIFNPHGTAPGVDFTLNREDIRCKKILAYPGVPAEMKEMWNLSGRNMVQNIAHNAPHCIRFRSIHSFGLGESQVEAMLPGIIDRKRVPKVGITATQGTITLRITAEGNSEAECFDKMKPTADWIYQTLGKHIFGEEDDTLPSVVLKKLQTEHKTVTVVEAGTRGLLFNALTKSGIRGAAEYLVKGGIVLPPYKPIVPDEMVSIGSKVFNPDYFFLIGNYPADENGETFVAVIDCRPKDGASAVLVFKNYPLIGHPDIIDDLYIKRLLNEFRLAVSRT